MDTVAAFDFDGTITYRDSLFPFLCGSGSKISVLKNFLISAPQVVGFASGILSRQQAKEAVLTQFFSGMLLEELQKKGCAFANEGLLRCIRPEALARIEWHRNQGHRLILVSASFDVYLEPWALANGFEAAITSRLEVDNQARVTGKIFGANCWGYEKVRRLLEFLGGKPKTLYAYGDSRGDQELLKLADYPYFRRMNAHD